MQARKLALAVAGALVISVVACEAPTVVHEEALPDHLYLAKGFALALQDPDVRLHFRDHLRDSPLTQHKLDLREYLESEDGERLLSASATALGESPRGLMEKVSALPSMDFYVPIREQRVSWSGDGVFAVAASMTSDAITASGFFPTGQEFTYTHDADNIPPFTLFFIHPAEARGERLVSPAEQDLETIQGALYEPHYVTRTVTDGEGNVISDEKMLVPATQREVSPWSLLATGKNTYFTSFWAWYGDGAGDCEQIYIAKYFEGSTKVKQVTVLDNDYPCPGGDEGKYEDGFLLIDRYPLNTGERVYVDVDEDDTFNNDDYGQGFWDPGENGALHHSNLLCDFGGTIDWCWYANALWQ